MFRLTPREWALMYMEIVYNAIAERVYAKARAMNPPSPDAQRVTVTLEGDASQLFRSRTDGTE